MTRRVKPPLVPPLPCHPGLGSRRGAPRVVARRTGCPLPPVQTLQGDRYRVRDGAGHRWACPGRRCQNGLLPGSLSAPKRSLLVRLHAVGARAAIAPTSLRVIQGTLMRLLALSALAALAVGWLTACSSPPKPRTCVGQSDCPAPAACIAGICQHTASGGSRSFVPGAGRVSAGTVTMDVVIGAPTTASGGSGNVKLKSAEVSR